MVYEWPSSIRSRIFLTLLGSLGLMSLVFMLGIRQHLSFVRWTSETVESSAMLAEVPLSVSTMVSGFESYTNTGVEDFREQFYLQVGTLDRKLHANRGRHTDEPLLSAYHRNLRTMFEYYRVSASSIIEQSVYDVEVYRELRFLRLLGSRMNLRAQELAVASIELSSREHSAALLQTQTVVRQVSVAIAGLFIVLMIGSIALVRDLSDHLARVESTARRLSRGDWQVEDLNETSYAELSSVADAFNEMKHSITEFIAAIEKNAELDARLHREQLANAEKERLLRQTQLLALQQQINPHFLFNTLNLISRTAMFRDIDSTIALVEAISSILRFNLDNGSRSVRLSQEIEILRSYILVQEKRFDGRVTIQLDVADCVSNPEVPPMILQPLVENSLVHGVKDRRRNALIRVRIADDVDFVTITVADNGSGVSADRIREIRSFKRPSGYEQQSIGLVNVKERLRLAFGPNSSLSIDSVPGEGTVVTIRIPNLVEAQA